MPISGLLITLEQPGNIREISAAILEICDAEIGDLEERWLPIAVDTSDSRTARDLHDQLLAIPGVGYIDVVSVAFEGDSPAAEGGSPLSKATRS